MTEFPYNGYVVIVSDEPIPGVPSYRIYGPFESREHARLALHDHDLNSNNSLTTGVLPLRDTAQMVQER